MWRREWSTGTHSRSHNNTLHVRNSMKWSRVFQSDSIRHGLEPFPIVRDTKKDLANASLEAELIPAYHPCSSSLQSVMNDRGVEKAREVTQNHHLI